MKTLIGVATLLLCSCAATGASSISWANPVFYYGPTASFEEVNVGKPGSAPALAAGVTEKVGLGQYPMLNHEWDVVDLGLAQLGGAVPGGTPAGMLQLGATLGTLNGLANLLVAVDCTDSTGTGVCQGGKLNGLILGGNIDVQALIAYFGTLGGNTSKAKGKLRGTNGEQLPRGGL